MAGGLVETLAACPAYVFFTFAAVCAGILWWRNRQYDSKYPPGPWGLPLVGHIPFLGKNPMPKLEEYRKQYGDVFSLRLGSYRVVVLNGLQTIKTALTRRPDEFGARPSVYSFKLISDRQNGNVGLSVPFGPRYKMMRKITNNALRTFANYRTNPVEDIITEEGNKLVSYFLSNGKTAVDPSYEISLSVGSVIYQILFGRDAKIREDKNYCAMIKSSRDFVEFATVGNPVDIMPWTRFFFQGRTKKFLSIIDIPYRVLATQSAHHQATYDSDSIRDVMDSLLKSAADVSQEEGGDLDLSHDLVMSVAVDLLGAGVDTVSTSILWGIFLMARYPEVQKRVQREIEEEIGMSRPPTMEDKKRLPFVEATVSEIMRLACITPLSVPRQTTVDVELGEYKIPKDIFIMINQQSTCMDPETWGDPDKFRPERFLTEDDKGKITANSGFAESFMVFGAGRRRCIGEFLAKIEIFLFFTLLMQRCSFAESPDEKLSLERKFGLTVKPKPFKIVATERV